MTQPKLGPQEPPDDPRIFNRRQPDGSFRPISEFFEPKGDTMTEHTPPLDIRFISERSRWVETSCDLCGETILESELRFVHRDQIICEKCSERDVTINFRELAQLRQDKTELLEMVKGAESVIRQGGHLSKQWLLEAEAAIAKAGKGS